MLAIFSRKKKHHEIEKMLVLSALSYRQNYSAVFWGAGGGETNFITTNLHVLFRSEKQQYQGTTTYIPHMLTPDSLKLWRKLSRKKSK